ncbi:MAG: rhizopine catabolism protein [Alphaproteobacteria bacterium]|nr:rhizopine catabolism protein [Alphaproteobacteria bacterium]
MEEVFSRRKIVTPVELKELNERSDLMGMMQMASHLGLIGALGYAHSLVMGSWWVLLTGFCLGVAVNFLYAAQHELSHWTVFRTKWLNEFFGRVIGFFMLFPRDYDLIMHYSHHRYTQDWDKDGELVREPYTLQTFLLWMSGVTYWRNRVVGIIRRARGIIIEPYIHANEEGKVVRESRWHLVGYAVILGVSIYLETWAAVTFWLLPMLLTKPVHQLQNTIEHLGLTHNDDILNNTRSTRTNAVMRWLCWQMPYHTAHHSFPSVPFWKLRRLNAKIEDACGEVHRMGWIEFQIEAVRRLRQKDESFYPMNEVWIVPASGGRQIKLEA